jgi:hypothetical protein
MLPSYHIPKVQTPPPSSIHLIPTPQLVLLKKKIAQIREINNQFVHNETKLIMIDKNIHKPYLDPHQKPSI